MPDFQLLRPQSGPLLPPVFDAFCDFAPLPQFCEAWPVSEPHSGGILDEFHATLAASNSSDWNWPTRPVVFISDPHADAESFLRSLVAAGVICRTGTGLSDFTLTGFGHHAHVVVGGDCLDKGPSNLDMLDALAALFATGATVTLLAGNHDLRLMLAVRALASPRDTLTEHLFVRMGRKALPLMREVWQRFGSPETRAKLPDEAHCRARICPRADWFERFPTAAAPHLSPEAIAKELSRLRDKGDQFAANVAAEGMTMREVFGAAQLCHDLFLQPGGAYHWFFQRMDVILQIGSVLFVHAGLDDQMCDVLVRQGPAAVNARFRRDAQRDLFAFYFGPVANLVRTKYRPSDKQLTDHGVALLHRAGLKLVVQGHVNNHSGQRLLAKRGLLHLEADVTLDRASRAREGLTGIGAGATLIYPSGDIIGLSSDYPKAKHFHPHCATLRPPAARPVAPQHIEYA